MADSKIKSVTGKLAKKFNTFVKTEYLPTGSLVLDIVMGGGLPLGKIIEVSSEAGVGKTTAILSLCVHLAEQGKKTIYLDHEGAITTSILDGVGLSKYLYNEETNPEGVFFLYQLQTYSDAEEVLDPLINTKEFTLVVVDSVTAMINDEYLTQVKNPDSKDKSISVSDIRPAMDARALGIFLKKYKAVCTMYNLSMILINQLRTSLSLTGGPSTKVSTGGKAVEFYPDIRLRLEKPQYIVDKRKTVNGLEDVNIGADVEVYSIKNKNTNAKIRVPMTIVFGRGISNINSYKKWLPNKTTKNENGEVVPMLYTKGGGYNIITLNGKTESVRGDGAVTQFIADHFDEIKACFSYKDFVIMEDKGYAEFKAGGGTDYREEAGETFIRVNVSEEDEEYSEEE